MIGSCPDLAIYDEVSVIHWDRKKPVYMVASQAKLIPPKKTCPASQKTSKEQSPGIVDELNPY